MLLLVSFVLSESKSPDKSVSLRLGQVSRGYWRVLTNRNFLMYGLAGSLAMAGLFTYIAGSPFVLMELYGFSEKTFGWVFGINAFGFIAVNKSIIVAALALPILKFIIVMPFLVACGIGLSRPFISVLYFFEKTSKYLEKLVSKIYSPNCVNLAPV